MKSLKITFRHFWIFSEPPFRLMECGIYIWWLRIQLPVSTLDEVGLLIVFLQSLFELVKPFKCNRPKTQPMKSILSLSKCCPNLFLHCPGSQYRPLLISRYASRLHCVYIFRSMHLFSECFFFRTLLPIILVLQTFLIEKL